MEYTSDMEHEVGRIAETGKEQNETNETSTTLTSSAPQQSRAVARKSTSKKQTVTDTNTYNPTTETKPSHSIVVSFSRKLKKKKLKYYVNAMSLF